MHRSPKWSPLAALAATLALVFAACGGTTSSASPAASEAPASAAPSAEATAAAPYEAMVYPEDGEVRLRHRRVRGPGRLDQGTRRRHGRVPRSAHLMPAFLAKIAFSVFGIQDADYLTAHAPTSRTSTSRTAPGPTRCPSGARATGWSSAPSPTTGATRPPRPPNLELRWSDEAAQRLLELQSGNVDGIDNPGPSDIATIQGDSSLQFAPRPGLNTIYLGFNDTIKPWDNVKVRQAIAMGIDRQRIVDNFYPEGSTVADYFTPCEIAVRLRGRRVLRVRSGGRQGAAGRSGLPERVQQTKLQFRAAVRGYLPDPPVIATEIAEPAQDQPRHHRDPGSPGVRCVPRRQRRGHARGHLHAGLGRGLSRPVQLPRLPLRRVARATSSARRSPRSWQPSTRACRPPTRPSEPRPTRRPTT